MTCPSPLYTQGETEDGVLSLRFLVSRFSWFPSTLVRPQHLVLLHRPQGGACWTEGQSRAREERPRADFWGIVCKYKGRVPLQVSQGNKRRQAEVKQSKGEQDQMRLW